MSSSISAPKSPTSPQSAQHPKSNIAMLVVLFASAFISGFSENLMNMALVSIMDEFSIGSVTAQWLVTAFMIVSTVMVTLTAFLIRRFNTRLLFFTAAGFLIVGSVIGLLSVSYPMVLAARLIQAVGSGVFIPLMMNSVLALAPRNKLGAFMSIGSCMITFGPAFAPVVCGGIVSSLGWRFIFAVPGGAMIIICLVAAFSLRNLGNSPSSLDGLSALLSALLLTLLSWGLSVLSTTPLLGIGMLVAAALVGVVFVRRQFTCEHPLIDLSPMKSPSFWPASILVIISMMSTFSSTVLLPLYLEGALGLNAAIAGVAILIPVLFNAAAALLGGRIMDSRGEWPLLPVGFVSIVVGFAGLALVSTSLSLPAVIVASLFVFCGVGVTLMPAQTAALRTLPAEMNPFGVAIMTTFVQIAACIGPALYTGLYSSGQAGALAEGIAANLACAQGFSLACMVAAVIAFIGLITAFVYVRKLQAARSAATTGHGATSHVAADRQTAGHASAGHAAAGAATPRDPRVTDERLDQIMEHEPFVVDKNSSVKDAIELLTNRKLGGLVLVDEAYRPAGFVSDGDIMRYLATQHPLMTGPYSIVAEQADATFNKKLEELLTLPVSAIATSSAVCIQANASLEDACDLLAKHRYKKVPVVKDGVVIGTVNRSDILRYCMSLALEE